VVDIINQTNYYINQGISVIPVRDKPQTWQGREYPVKSAYPWKRWQTELITPQELLYLMADKYSTTGYGLVGGAVSGNLEIIDVDTKNWAGIEIRLFQDIRTLLPHIWPMLRIHQTPSKGYHIFYRVSDHAIPGNLKLAWKDGAKEAALESRGEGGYVVASSTMGYIVTHDNPIPTISWQERCSLIAICEGYNEKIKVAPVVVSRAQNDFYDENPFVSFNNSSAGENVLLDNGWTTCGGNSNFLWFTRPGKTSGVSASFNLAKRCYYVFTSSTELDPSRGYNPSTLLSLYSHANDKKATFKWLVDNGYGKVKGSIELSRTKKAARKNISLPNNFSDEAKALAVNIRGELEALHAYGEFWDFGEENKVSISRERLSIIADSLGFKYHKGNVVRIIGYLIHNIEEREFQDAIKGYIKEPDNDVYLNIANSFESFMEAHGKYTMKRLPILDTTLILTDNANTCYKFYQNGYLCITSINISFLEYDTLEAFIWAEKLQARNYNRTTFGGVYRDFLNKALVTPKDAAKIIGYLAHEYKDETTGYIIVLTEQCQNPKDGGGSGKNVFCSLFSKTTTLTSKPGVQSKFDEKFFNSWNGQKIFCISDVPKDFDFSFLKEPSTGSFIWKKMFKDEVEVGVEDAPKFIIQTNFSYEIKDGGLRRRIIPLEFTDYFTRCGGLDVKYGKHFPKGWDSTDWGGFDTYVAECIQEWLLGNRKLSAAPLTAAGWDKQFTHTYGEVITGIIHENIAEWIKEGEVSSESFKATIEAYYSDNNIPKMYQPSTVKINAALTAWMGNLDGKYVTQFLKREGGYVKKYRQFMDRAPF
jgi:hypothetical protein